MPLVVPTERPLREQVDLLTDEIDKAKALIPVEDVIGDDVPLDARCALAVERIGNLERELEHITNCLASFAETYKIPRGVWEPEVEGARAVLKCTS